jgi:hypothetical protein
LKRITNGFKNNIGIGGFGSVYLGIMDSGVEVAVKMHSNSSSQGAQELLTEVITTVCKHTCTPLHLSLAQMGHSCCNFVYLFIYFISEKFS